MHFDVSAASSTSCARAAAPVLFCDGQCTSLSLCLGDNISMIVVYTAPSESVPHVFFCMCVNKKSESFSANFAFLTVAKSDSELAGSEMEKCSIHGCARLPKLIK